MLPLNILKNNIFYGILILLAQIVKNYGGIDMKKIFSLIMLLFVSFYAVYAQNNIWDIAWNEKGALITAYNGSDRAINIPEKIADLPVVGIGENTFHNKQLTSVNIPNSVISIGSNAFANNPLTSIKIPANVTLGAASFGNNFIEIYSNNGKKAGTYNFMNYGGEWAVVGWVNEAGEGAFIITGYYGNDNVITIPPRWGNLPIIGIQGTTRRKCFHGISITSIIIPNSIIFIGSNTFADTGLTSVTIPNSIISIGNEAFSGNQLTTVTIPNSVTTIGGAAFSNNKLQSIVIPNNVISIGDNAFLNNPLTSVVIGNNVTNIGKGAFLSSSSSRNSSEQLVNIIIPANVSLFMNRNSYSFTDRSFPGNFDQVYNNGNRRAGKYTYNNDRWVLTTITFADGITTIGDREFERKGLTSITIPNSITSIGNYAFNHNQLTNIIIPNNVTSIGTNAFSGNQLVSVTFSNRLSTIGANAFSGNQLENVNIPNVVTSIGESAFSNNKLTSIIIPNSVTLIGNSAFSNNPIVRITIPANLSLSNNPNTPAFPNNFDAFYYSNQSKAGIYTFINNVSWSYSAQ
jgi:hypothetical protein